MKHMKKALYVSLFFIASITLSAQQYDARAYITDTEIGTASFYADGLQGITTSSGEPYRMEAFTAAHPSYPMGTKLRVTNLDRNLMVEVRVNDRIPAQGSRILNLSKAAAYQLGMLTAGTARVRVERIQDNSYAASSYGNSSTGLTARSPYAAQSNQQASGWTPQQQKTYNPKEYGAPAWAGQLFRDENYPAPRTQPQTSQATTSYSGTSTPSEYGQAGLTAKGYSQPVNSPASNTGQGNYAIQLASYTEVGNAQSHINQLRAKGYSNAYIWQKDGKNRVVLAGFSDKASAFNYLATLRQQYMDGIVVLLR